MFNKRRKKEEAPTIIIKAPEDVLIMAAAIDCAILDVDLTLEQRIEIAKTLTALGYKKEA